MIKTKMDANSKRPRGNVDYVRLHDYSSVVLYDMARKVKGEFLQC